MTLDRSQFGPVQGRRSADGGIAEATVALVAGWALLALSFFPLVMTLLGLNVAPREAVTGAGVVMQLSGRRRAPAPAA